MKLNTLLWISGLVILLAVTVAGRRAPGSSDPLLDPNFRDSAGAAGDGRVAGVPVPTLKALPRGGAPRQRLRLADSRVDEVRARSRKAMGFDQLSKLRDGLLVEGDTRLASAGGRFSLLFNPAGCYLQEVVGPLNVALGHDGTDGWVLASARGPSDVEISDVTIPQAVTWVQAGRWLVEDGPFEVTVPAGEAGLTPNVLELRLNSDGTRARLELDPNTWLPAVVSWNGSGRDERWRLEQWSESLGVVLPRLLVREQGRERAEFRVRSVGRAPIMAGNPYAPLQSRLSEIRARRDIRPQGAAAAEPA